ncbi:MAG: manganese efflux pump [Ethanoligenens sp.]
MGYLAIFLFALSANLDNFTVAITYGMRKIQIGPIPNLLIAGISGGGTLLFMTVGVWIGRFLPHSIADIIGSLLLIGIGIWSIKGALCAKSSKPRHNNGIHLSELLDAPEKADADANGSIDLREATILAFALTINNAGLGLGASIAGVDILLTTLCTTFFSLAAIFIGCLIGKNWASRLLGRFAPLIAGIAIAALGVYELIPVL